MSAIPGLAESVAIADQALAAGIKPQEAFAAFQREADEYLNLAESGDRDWADFDSQASADCLLAVFKTLSSGVDARERVADARSLIHELICRNARRHAQQCLENGVLA